MDRSLFTLSCPTIFFLDFGTQRQPHKKGLKLIWQSVKAILKIRVFSKIGYFRRCNRASK